MAAKKAAPPKFPKAPAALCERFTRAASALPGAELRTMFGYPAAFVAGNMFAGVFGDGVMLRLSEAERAECGWAPFEPMKGRPLREYVLAPASVSGSQAKLSAWAARAHAFAKTLPPKSATRKAARSAPRKQGSR
jgi:TfoX/Sxy family transcriptional regulator of competence genes